MGRKARSKRRKSNVIHIAPGLSPGGKTKKAIEKHKQSVDRIPDRIPDGFWVQESVVLGPKKGGGLRSDFGVRSGFVIGDALVYRGTTELFLDLSKLMVKRLGRPGMPWGNGMLRLETNPALTPVVARGLGTDPGVFWRLRNNPHVEAALKGPIAAIMQAPRRLEKPKLPKWADDEDKAALERQWVFCQRVWHEWTHPGNRRGVQRFCRDVMETAPICGFYIGEHRGKPKLWKIGGERRAVISPIVPEYRAPWSTCEWITMEEDLIAVLLTLSHSRDSFESQGPFQQVLPGVKMVHVGLDVGSNYEGRSFTRAAYQVIKMLQKTLQIEGLASETNGLGTWILKMPDSGDAAALKADKDRLENHFLSYVATHVPFVTLPFGWDATLVSPQAGLPNMTPRINALERMVSLAMGSAHLLIATQKAGGSFAARQDASREATSGWDWIADDFVARPLQQTLDRFLRINFPRDAANDSIWTPRILHGSVANHMALERAQALQQAMQSGLLDDPEYGPIVRALLRIEDVEGATALERLGPKLEVQPPGRPQEQTV